MQDAISALNELARAGRIVPIGNVARARSQVQYILDCGGTARHIEHIVNSMKVEV